MKKLNEQKEINRIASKHHPEKCPRCGRGNAIIKIEEWSDERHIWGSRFRCESLWIGPNGCNHEWDVEIKRDARG